MSLPSFVPDAGPAPLGRMLVAQAGLELRLSLRQGEQLTLTLVIPVLITLGLVLTTIVDAGAGLSRADYFLPGILALAIISSSFTGLAISTGFERKYGVLKRLGATSMPRTVLLAGKALAVLALEVLQLAVLVVLGVALGWRPDAVGVPAALVVVVLGAASFAALALLMAGTLRAEATLAAANLVWFLLLLGGGVLLPLSRLGHGAADVLQLLPSAALADGLRATLQTGSFPTSQLGVLVVWGVAAGWAAQRWFRWE